jgi:dTDP-4-amino-4,6-dideoxygalactose transaminase
MKSSENSPQSKEKLTIPFGTITITDKAKQLVMQALETKRISCGRLVHEFEQKFASLYGVHEAVAVSSGTDAVALALAVLYDYGAQRGDEIIVPALSFVATGNAVLQAGFTPIFVDIERETLNINPELIEKAITEHTRAIMPVHLMGKPVEMDPVMDIAHRHNLFVIEDAAEAYGATYKGKQVGTIGDLSAFSLYVAHIITTGEGGIVLTNDEEKAEILRSLRSHGRACKCETCVLNLGAGYCAKRFNNPAKTDIRFVFERVGFSAKMNELEAAIGIGCLDYYDDILAKRRKNFYAMSAIIQKYGKFMYTIDEGEHCKIGPHALPIILKETAPFTRDVFVDYLERNGVDSRNLFQSIPTQCAGFKFLGHKLGEFPEAEYVADHGLHVGVHQDINEAQIRYLDNVIADFIKKQR